MPNLYIPKSSPRSVVEVVPTKVQQQVVKTIDGQQFVVFETKEIDPTKVNEGLTAADFKLDVLMENNAVDLLKPTSPIKQSNMMVASTIENFENYE